MPLARAAALPEPSASRRISPDRAIRIALDAIAGLPPLPVRTAALVSCHDRVLAQRVRAEADIPPRDSAGADGYAFSGAVLRGDGPWRLRLTGRIAVARNLAAENAFPSREAVRITADAAIPPQLDTVIPADTVRREGRHIVLDARPHPRESIRGRGEDARCGDVLAQPDRLLDVRDIATLTAAGYTGVKVRRTMRVAALSVGNGRQEAGDATRAMLMAMLDRRWISRRDSGAIGCGALAETLGSTADDIDVMIIIGRNRMAETVEAAGGRAVLDGIAIRPGGTVKIAVLGDTALVLLPEEPVAALTAMAVLGWPLLRRRAGIQHSRGVPRAGVAGFSLAADPECASCPLIRVTGSGDIPTLEALDGSAGSVTSLSMADGIALLAPGEAVRFGSRVAWMPLSDRFC